MTDILHDHAHRAAVIKRETANLGWRLDDAGADPSMTRMTAAQKAATVQSILNTALVAEQIAVAFYYSGLSSRGVMGDSRLSGKSADPNNPGLPPGGDPANVSDLQACLDAEVKHAAALLGVNATSPYKHFYFPATTFKSLGSTTMPGTFLATMDALETAFVGAYIAAVNEFLGLGRPDLAGVIAQIMGVEAEHRVLARVIANVDPANNLTLQKAPYTTVAAASKALLPYVSGKGLPGGATAGIALPSASQATYLVGRHPTRIVKSFLPRTL